MTLRPVSRAMVFALVLVLLCGQASLACGPFTLDAIFVYTAHPAYPLAQFARGKIGVVQPSYARSYLYVAYRSLNNLPFTQYEQKELVSLWEDRLNLGWHLNDEEWTKVWIDARSKVTGAGEAPRIDVYRSREKPNEYETYLNCQKDSFESAIATLTKHIAKFGPDNEHLRDWLSAQDQVFANCSEGQHIPTAANESADSAAKADRAYQIAAANFYAGNFDEARKRFEVIAADSHSEWHTIAPYLVARTLIRKAALGPEESKNASLTEAEALLNKLLPKSNGDTHAAELRLLDLVRNRLHPKQRIGELAAKLTGKDKDATFKQDLWDYTVLLDQFLDTDSGEPKSVSDDELLASDLTNWLATLEDSSPVAKERAFNLWRKMNSQAWLIAAITKASSEDAQADELISQALRIKRDSPAFPSSRFHAARLLIGKGRTSEARTLLDQILKENRAQFDQSSLNQLIDLRIKLSTTLEEFLSYAPRVPAALSWNDDGREIPAGESEVPDETKPKLGQTLFEPNTAKVINQMLPLSVLKEAAISSTLPVELRRDLVQATWVRAVLLDNYKTADELVPILKELVPELSSYLNEYARATETDEKKFDAIYAWLKFPGLEPVVDSGIGRQTPLKEQDIYRDNWWCSAVYPDASEDDATSSGETATAKPKVWVPGFINEVQRARGEREFKSLMGLGAAPNYLCRQAVVWGRKNPNDPRVPEALHLAVNSTRHGCTDKETGRWSKAAFDLLHARYPASTWAKKTPYWFKD